MSDRGDSRAADLLKAIKSSLKVVNVDVDELTCTYTYAELKPLLLCRVCNGMIQDPYYVDECEHMFCKDCIELLRGKRCPGWASEVTCSEYIGPAQISSIRKCKVLEDVIAAVEKGVAERAGGAAAAPSATAGGGDT